MKNLLLLFLALFSFTNVSTMEEGIVKKMIANIESYLTKDDKEQQSLPSARQLLEYLAKEDSVIKKEIAKANQKLKEINKKILTIKNDPSKLKELTKLKQEWDQLNKKRALIDAHIEQVYKYAKNIAPLVLKQLQKIDTNVTEQSKQLQQSLTT